MVGVAMANYAAFDPPDAGRGGYNGHSVAFSGICFDVSGHLEHKLVEAGESEGIFLAKFDLDALRAYRSHQTWGDAYRKPAVYGPIVADSPAAIFKRSDSRR
jgi:predicted amidohydrolase